MMQKRTGLGIVFPVSLALLACSGEGVSPKPRDTVAPSLAQRAYVVSLGSDELTVVDLEKLEIIKKIPTGGVSNHMVELSATGEKAYVSASGSNEVIVVDTRSFEVTKRIPVGHHGSHVSRSADGQFIAVMIEDDNAVAFIDTETDEVVKTLNGFAAPHFMRFTPDGRYGYVANIGAHHITRVDMKSLEVDGHIPLDGYDENAVAAEEGGFADVQIAADGVLYAAHHATGRVLAYDTNAQVKLPEIQVGTKPWVVFAEHPFLELPSRHLVPNFGDKTVSLINGASRTVQTALPGDEEAYGVNFSPLTPNQAFVMNRIRQDIAVMDTEKGTVLKRIPVGGNTETASTTADGKLIVATVSGADSVVVLDPSSLEIVKRFPNIGKYPWGITIPGGQNYCH